MNFETIAERILCTVAAAENYKRKNLYLHFNNSFEVRDYNHERIVKFNTIEEFEIKYKTILK